MRYIFFCLQFSALALFFAVVGSQIVVPKKNTPVATRANDQTLTALTEAFHSGLDELAAALEAYAAAAPSAPVADLQNHHLAA
ncbi:MAG: hypothetical protein HC821_02960, partial [Lewinella sp.]|nr:hypothetical protein [Lewinella sp.]